MLTHDKFVEGIQADNSHGSNDAVRTPYLTDELKAERKEELKRKEEETQELYRDVKAIQTIQELNSHSRFYLRQDNYLDRPDLFPSRDEVLGPWKNRVLTDIDSDEYVEMIKLIHGSTAQGKTFLTVNSGIPHLAKKGVRLFILPVPMTELADVNDIEDTLHNIFSNDPELFHLTPTVRTNLSDSDLTNDIKRLINAPSRVIVLVGTHSKIIDSEKGYPKSLRYFHKVFKQDSFCVWGEELHYGGASSEEALGWNGLGNGKNYRFRLHKFLQNCLKMTRYVMGNTATPTPEMKNPSLIENDNNYQLIGGEWVSPKALLSGYKWQKEWKEMGSLTKESVVPVVGDFLTDLVEKNEVARMLGEELDIPHFVSKLTGLIFCQADHESSKNYYSRIREIHKAIVEIATERQYTKEQLTWGHTYTLKGGKTFYTIFWIGEDGTLQSENRESSSDYVSDMNNGSESVNLMLVKQKGNMGVNIHSLTAGLNLIPSNSKKDCNNDPVTYTAIQKIGRFNRPYFGATDNPLHGSTKNISFEEIRYYLKNKSSSVINGYFETFNTYSFTTASSDVWKEANMEFGAYYGVTLMDVHTKFGWV